MKRFLTLFLLAAAGCVTEPQRPIGGPRDPKPVEKSSEELAIERRVAEHFDEWVQATIAGDFDKHYGGMTAGFISHWVWQRTKDTGDMRWNRWDQQMPSKLRPAFTAWLKENDRLKPDRAYLLPDGIFNDPWLKQCYQDYFRADYELVKLQLTMGQVAGVAVDSTGATIIKRLPGPLTEQWVMGLSVTGRWLVDGYVAPRK